MVRSNMSTLLIQEVQVCKDLLDHIVTAKAFGCTVYHAHTSCYKKNLVIIGRSLIAVMKVNTPIHLIPLLLFKRVALKNQ